MKFNFRQVSAIASSLMMVGLTAGTALAANYPQPFVQSGVADVAVVYGTGSGVSALDAVQAGNIQTDLQGFISGSGGSTTTGDSVRLAKATDEFNLGNTANTFFSSGIDGDDLSVVLADGVYRNDGNDEFDYEQEINVGSLTLAHFQDSDFNNDEPVIGFDLSDGTHILNYTLDFTPDNAESNNAADWNELEGTTINMLGKEYYILSASNATAGSETLELLDSASDAIVNAGETVSVTAGGTTYQVSLTFIDDDEVRLTINGETTPSLNEDETFKLDTGDYIGIKEIGFQNFQGGTQQAEFSIGSGKIELTNAQEIQLNGEDLSDTYDHTLTAFVTASGTELDSVTISWAVDDDMWLAFDTSSKELVMPAFGNVKLALGNFVTDAAEVTSIEPDGDDKFKLKTDVTDGSVDFNFLFYNGTNFSVIGKDADELLYTSTGSFVNWTANSKWFVATWVNGDDYESYLLEVSDIDDSKALNTTRIRSVASGSNTAIDLDIGETDEIGEISFTLDRALETGEIADLTVAAASGNGNINLSRVVTAEGLQIQLPFDVQATSGIGSIDIGNATSWVMHVTEENRDGDIAQGVSFNFTLGVTSDGETTVTSIAEQAHSGDQDFETTDGSDDYIGYIQSDLATMTLFETGGDQDSLDLTYHGSEVYGEVFVSEAGAAISGGSAGDLLVRDTEVSSVQSKNLVVVGGSCINSVAANLVGGALCGSSWTSSTGVGSGQFLIQSFGGAYTSGKVALLVAGYEAAETQMAATYLTTQTVDTAAGNKYIGTSSTSAELQVA